MEVRFNVTGAQRKEMVNVVSEALGGWTVEYLGVPTFTYRVGDFDIAKDGTLVFADRTDSEMVEQVLEALAQAGFECAEADKPAVAAENEPVEEVQPETVAAVDANEIVPAEESTADEPISLSVSLPRDSFTDAALDNLDGLLESKGNLIRRAFGIEEASYTLTDDHITFAWLSGEVTPEGSRAFQDFIGKLCEMARKQKRVTAKQKSYENEKYAFRCFLLRLGLIGAEYKTTRKELLKNLGGNSSWRDGHRREAAQDEISEQGAD